MMKRIYLYTAILLLSSNLFAEEPSCARLLAACQASGAYTSKHDAWRGCVSPIVAGKRIRGVHVERQDISDCIARIEMHKPGAWRK